MQDSHGRKRIEVGIPYFIILSKMSQKRYEVTLQERETQLFINPKNNVFQFQNQ